MCLRVASLALAAALALAAQEQPKPPDSGETASPILKEGVVTRDAAKSPNADQFVVQTGTKIPLSMINSISTKSASDGDRVYLETVFPILVNGKVVIPPGSYVAGTVTESKRAGRVKGRGELWIRFDSLTLPNGVTRDFRARLGTLDGTASESLDKAEGKIKGEGDKAGDLKTVGEAAGAGATLGSIAGAAAGRPGLGAGIGAAAGATAGLMGVLLSRGPDAVLARGTTMEMVTDRPLEFNTADIDFRNAMPHAQNDGPGPPPSRKQQRSAWPIP